MGNAGIPGDNQHPIQGRVELLQVNQNNLRPDGPLGSYAD